MSLQRYPLFLFILVLFIYCELNESYKFEFSKNVRIGIASGIMHVISKIWLDNSRAHRA